METLTKSSSTKQMHKIVWILVGVFALIAGTFPIGMWRVTQMEKFRGVYVKSFPMEGQLKKVSEKAPNTPTQK